MSLIGLNGFRGSGKDTVGEYLADNYGFVLKKFAGPLYDSCAALFGVPVSVFDSLKNDSESRVVLRGIVKDASVEVSLTVRQFMQRYGTEAHREIFGSNFWVDECMKSVDPTQRTVITDARFENELEAVRDNHGINVQIIRPGINPDGHASEIAPKERLIDYYIHNDDGIDKLYQEADDLMEWLGVKKNNLRS